MFTFPVKSRKDNVFELVRRMNEKLPGYGIKFTGMNWHHPILRWKTIWFHGERFPRDDTETIEMLAWAYVFVTDRKLRPMLSWLLYWFPWYLAFLSLGSILVFIYGPWMLLFSLSLLVLLIRRPFVCGFYAHAYAGSLAAYLWMHHIVPDEKRSRVVTELTANGLMTQPAAEAVIDEYLRVSRVDSILGETILDDSEAFRDIYEVLTSIDLDEE